MRKNRVKLTGGLFFFFGSSFHPSGATLLSFMSGSTKKNSLSARNIKQKHKGKSMKTKYLCQMEDKDQIYNSETGQQTAKFSID